MEGERTGKTGMTGLLLSVVPTREERWREREDEKHDSTNLFDGFWQPL